MYITHFYSEFDRIKFCNLKQTPQKFEAFGVFIIVINNEMYIRFLRFYDTVLVIHHSTL